MKKIANKNIREIKYMVGDHVFIKLQLYRFHSFASCPNEKLSPCFYGLYEIEEKIGKVAYKLKLPEIVRIHPLFHVSQLKKRVGLEISSYCLTEEVKLEVNPEKEIY